MFKKIFFLVSVFCCITLSMEKEEPSIPTICESHFEIKPVNTQEELKKKYEATKKNFDQIYLDNFDQFAKSFRSKAKKENEIEFLTLLQKYASFLLWQHEMIQSLMNYCYTKSFQLHLTKQIDCIVENSKYVKLKKIKGSRLIIAQTEDPYILSIVMRHKPLLFKPVWDVPEIKEFLVPWLLSENQELRFLAGLQKLLKELVLAQDQSNKYFIGFYNLFSLPKESYFDDLPFNENLMEPAILIGLAYIQNKKIMEKKITEKEKLELAIKKYQAIIEMYEASQHLYLRAYENIRKLLQQLVVEQLRQNPGSLKVQQFFTPTIPFETIKVLPVSMTPLKDPNAELLITYDQVIQILIPEVAEKLKKENEKERARKERRKKARALKKEMIQKTSESISKKIEEESIESVQITPIILMQAKDGSYILDGDITDTTITIINPENDTVETIFKTEQHAPLGFAAPNYTPWVAMWFENPKQALELQGYTKAGDKKYTTPNMLWKPLALHKFSQLVDSFINEWGTQTEIPSKRVRGKKDILITLPGMIQYPEGKKDEQGKPLTQETGVFAYIIDSSNNQWYHRMFEPQSTQKLIGDLFEKGYFAPEMKGYYDVVFPPLGAKK